MDSRRLSQRAIQPGHDQTFRASEQNFIAALEGLLPSAEWEIVDHPRDLERIFGNRYGVVPEAKITYLPTGRYMYFEVKKQGERGNAEERAAKHHTVQFYKTLAEVTGLGYHPFVTVMCESLSTLDRYTIKHPYYFEEGHYFNWVDYDLEALAAFIDEIAIRWLAGPEDGEPQQVPE
jgi:hypothetical protein